MTVGYNAAIMLIDESTPIRPRNTLDSNGLPPTKRLTQPVGTTDWSVFRSVTFALGIASVNNLGSGGTWSLRPRIQFGQHYGSGMMRLLRWWDAADTTRFSNGVDFPALGTAAGKGAGLYMVTVLDPPKLMHVDLGEPTSTNPFTMTPGGSGAGIPSLTASLWAYPKER